jgi:hypothetical protein
MRKVFNHQQKKVEIEGLELQNGHVVAAPTYFYKGDDHTIQEGKRYLIEQASIEIFDDLIAQPLKIYGGAYWVDLDDVDKVSKDDYLEFSIVDKDDVLGMFGLLGITPGEGVLEITKFVKKDYIRKGDPATGFYSDLVSNTKGVSEIIPGLYRRLYYFSYGSQPITLYTKYFYQV